MSCGTLGRAGSFSGLVSSGNSLSNCSSDTGRAVVGWGLEGAGAGAGWAGVGAGAGFALGGGAIVGDAFGAGAGLGGADFAGASGDLGWAGF